MTFRCPTCQGSAFGSVLDADDPKGPLRRYCHGNDAGDGAEGCRFSWPQNEDWRYFTFEGEKLTREAFEARMEELRRMSIKGVPWPAEEPEK